MEQEFMDAIEYIESLSAAEKFDTIQKILRRRLPEPVNQATISLVALSRYLK